MNKLSIKFFYIFILIVNILIIIGCEKSGELPNSLNLNQSFVVPTISNLSISNNVLARSKGGIIKISCKWCSPNEVASSWVNIVFVKSIFDGLASYSGVIDILSSDAATIPTITTSTTSIFTYNNSNADWNVLNENFNSSSQVATLSNVQLATDTQSNPNAFYSRFSRVLTFPVEIGTDKHEGILSLDLPFPKLDIIDAPLGNHIFVLWMVINGRKTNSLAFEIKIVD